MTKPSACPPHNVLGLGGPVRGSMHDPYPSGPSLEELDWHYTCLTCKADLIPGDEPGTWEVAP